MRQNINQSIRVMLSTSLLTLSCSKDFQTNWSLETDGGKETTTVDGGTEILEATTASKVDPNNHQANTVKPISKREASASNPIGEDSGLSSPEGSVDAGSKPDAPIRVQDSGRPETSVKKPWYLTSPDAVCVTANPNNCPTGYCSCANNLKPWCCRT
jgi:hypothetical protein